MQVASVLYEIWRISSMESYPLEFVSTTSGFAKSDVVSTDKNKLKRTLDILNLTALGDEAYEIRVKQHCYWGRDIVPSRTFVSDRVT